MSQREIMRQLSEFPAGYSGAFRGVRFNCLGCGWFNIDGILCDLLQAADILSRS